MAKTLQTSTVLKAAMAEQTEGDKDLNKMAAMKAKLEATKRDVFKPLQTGTMSAYKAQKAAASLSTIGKELQFDETLLSELLRALSTKPKERGPIEQMVLQAFETQLITELAELDRGLTELTPGRDSRAAVVQRAQDSHDDARKSSAGRDSPLSCLRAHGEAKLLPRPASS